VIRLLFGWEIREGLFRRHIHPHLRYIPSVTKDADQTDVPSSVGATFFGENNKKKTHKRTNAQKNGLHRYWVERSTGQRYGSNGDGTSNLYPLPDRIQKKS
jgi:hypothetical protein